MTTTLITSNPTPKTKLYPNPTIVQKKGPTLINPKKNLIGQSTKDDVHGKKKAWSFRKSPAMKILLGGAGFITLVALHILFPELLVFERAIIVFISIALIIWGAYQKLTREDEDIISMGWFTGTLGGWVKGEPDPSLPNATLNVMIDPNAYEHNISDRNKLVAYRKLTKWRALGDPVHFLKCDLENQQEIANYPVINNGHIPRFENCTGAFPYPRSSIRKKHFTVNFADPYLMNFHGGDLLAQDELQVLEHPALAHVEKAIRKNGQNYLDKKSNQIAIAMGVPRYGKLDTRGGLYGNNFSRTTEQVVLDRLKRFIYPVLSNILFLVAPDDGVKDQPYKKTDLEILFYRAYNGFWSCRQTCWDGQSCVIHTGNWGCGAFGHNPKVIYLIQMAAAYAAGVDVNFYPMNQSETYNEAHKMFKELITRDNLTVEGFLTLVQQENLTFGEGNGT